MSVPELKVKVCLCLGWKKR